MTELTNKGMANAWAAAETELAALMARVSKAEKALAEANRVAGVALESNSANLAELNQARRRIVELVEDRDRYAGYWQEAVRAADRVNALEKELEEARGVIRRAPWSAEEAVRELDMLRTQLTDMSAARDALSFEFARFRDTAERAQRDMLSQRDTWAERAKEVEKGANYTAGVLEKTFEALGAARLAKANVQAKLDEAQTELADTQKSTQAWADLAGERGRRLERAEPLFAAARAWTERWADSPEAVVEVMLNLREKLGMAAAAFAREEARHA